MDSTERTDFSPALVGPSSRTSDAGAGWQCAEIGDFSKLMRQEMGKDGIERPKEVKRLSWFNPKTLITSRNDILAKGLLDPVDAERVRWVGASTTADLRVDLGATLDDFSFMLVGDTGEGDKSQYAVVPPLVAMAKNAAFLFICSDVLYPIGNVNDYIDKFYRPYSHYEGPIYGIPGNHDWYDNLDGFMWHLCAKERDTMAAPEVKPTSIRARLQRRLWRKSPARDEALWKEASDLRQLPVHKQTKPQPGPYYVIDTRQLRLVCIDTGITKHLDKAQGEWLVEVSNDPRPKVLLTGSPLYVDGKEDAIEIAGSPSGFATVNAVVKATGHRYVAAIGGDIHNYQRYPVGPDDHKIQYIVSGGGGAFMHATHLIPPIEPCRIEGFTEKDFHCYPIRRDSLAAYSRLFDNKMRRLRPPSASFAITSDEAALYLISRYNLPALESRPIDPAAQLTLRVRFAGYALLKVGGGKTFHKFFSPFLDWDEPPFFKHFLRLDVADGKLRIRCFGVTGCLSDEQAPNLEDEVEIDLRR